MGAEIAIEREKLTARELQVLDHLEQAQNLDAPLTEYCLCRMRHNEEHVESRTMPRGASGGLFSADLAMMHSA